MNFLPKFSFSLILKSFARFPMTFISSLLMLIFSILYLQYPYDGPIILLRLFLVTILGIFFFTAVSIVIERFCLKIKYSIIVYTIASIILVLYFIFFINELNKNNFRLIAVIISLLFFIFYAGFIRNDKQNNFEIFTVKLFLRFFVAILFSGFIFLGLTFALITIDSLFEVTLHENLYFMLFMSVASVFTIPYFLCGVPDKEFDYDSFDYPKILKILISYIFLPLLVIYLTILYIYSIKIAVTFTLPIGSLSIPIVIFSIFGILSLFLISPIQRKTDSKWLNIFSRLFYFALIPMIVMLYISIYKRIFDYGITESRYIILIIGLWLTGIAVYFIITKGRNKIIIPVTISIISILIFFGPWSAFNVSYYSQYRKLISILTENNYLESGKLVKKDILVSEELYDKINNLFSYFEKNNQLNKLSIIDENENILSANHITNLHFSIDESNDTNEISVYNNFDYISTDSYRYISSTIDYPNYYENSIRINEYLISLSEYKITIKHRENLFGPIKIEVSDIFTADFLNRLNSIKLSGNLKESDFHILYNNYQIQLSFVIQEISAELNNDLNYNNLEIKYRIAIK